MGVQKKEKLSMMEMLRQDLSKLRVHSATKDDLKENIEALNLKIKKISDSHQKRIQKWVNEAEGLRNKISVLGSKVNEKDALIQRYCLEMKNRDVTIEKQKSAIKTLNDEMNSTKSMYQAHAKKTFENEVLYEKEHNKKLADKIVTLNKNHILEMECKDLEITRVKKQYVDLNTSLNKTKETLKIREKERDAAFKKYTNGLQKVREFEKMENIISKLNAEIIYLKQEIENTKYQKSDKSDWELSYKKLKEEYKTIQKSSFEILGNFQAFLMTGTDDDELQEIYKELSKDLKKNLDSLKELLKDANFIRSE